jgi:hypothetical protein
LTHPRDDREQQGTSIAFKRGDAEAQDRLGGYHNSRGETV